MLEPHKDPNAASFGAIRDDVFASRCDVLCDLFSLGIHRSWKSRIARRIAAEPWQNMLDVAAGTGEFALRCERRFEGHPKLPRAFCRFQESDTLRVLPPESLTR